MDTWMFEVYMMKDASLENRLIEEAKKLGGILEFREDEGDRIVLTLEFTDPDVVSSAMGTLALLAPNVHIEGPYPYG